MADTETTTDSCSHSLAETLAATDDLEATFASARPTDEEIKHAIVEAAVGIRLAERKDARGEDGSAEGGHWVRILRRCADALLDGKEG